jgi:exopolyphosphatase/guanosine-5'-triphosphate,3'-diphosphate pyrophosphatase
MGSVRMTERFLHSDPPTKEELDACASAVRQMLADRVPADVRNDAHAAIGVAGTITSLAALDLELEEYDRDRVHRHVLTREGLQQQVERLASLTVAERRELPAFDPDRAPVIVGGAVVACEVVGFLGVDGIEVSERDILDGAALTAAELHAEEEGAAPPGAYTCC